MPEPLTVGRRYLPGLDGLRALAVGAVVLYHLGYGWAAGGFLGVGVFFTLSGYLITDLILAQTAGGTFRMSSFWRARARRLLPALAIVLAGVSAWVIAFGGARAGYVSALVAAVLYVSNWQLVFQHVSYFARFGPPSPLQHLWSLGVEEQFYIVWPALLLLGARVIRERSRVPGVRPRLAFITLLLAVASAVEMALLYRPSVDTSRVYFGTDTRAFELLAGAALAMVWPSRRLRANIAVGARRLCDAGGLIGLAAIALIVSRVDEYSPFVYRGGFVVLTCGTVLLVAALVHPGARLAKVVGAEPLRWIGVRSYGIYLWHLPVIVLTTPAGEHRPQLMRSSLQVAAIVGLAALSWRFVEEPVRHGALSRLRDSWQRRHLRRIRPRRRRLIILVPTAILLTIGALALAVTGTNKNPTVAEAPTLQLPLTHDLNPLRGVVRFMVPQTSCRAVVHIGDSTSEGLTSTNYLPNPIQRIESRYRSVGVSTQHYEISGARSVVETYEGEPNAADVVRAWKQDGYRGCWVLAIGTNDTADVDVGSHIDRPERVREMMSLIGRNAPVMWVDVKSLLSSGPYSEENMERWNRALQQACRTYPNMRVYEWSVDAHDKWFISDGIHYNTPGYAARARLIAYALAAAFPTGTTSTGCLVG